MSKKRSRKKALAGLEKEIKKMTLQEKGIMSATETGKDILFGVIGGGIAAALVGKHSLPVGVIVTGTGHFMNKPLIRAMGLGMMASNNFSKGSLFAASDGYKVDELNSRVMNFAHGFASKAYLEKVLFKAATGATNGLGALQYTEPDFSALDNLHLEVLQSGQNYQKFLSNNPTTSAPEQSPVNGSDDADFADHHF